MTKVHYSYANDVSENLDTSTVNRVNGYIGRSNWGVDGYLHANIEELQIFTGIFNND